MAITYSIDGGADAAKFNINSTSGALTFKVAPDFEKPGDANADNIYEVSVKAADAGGLSTSKLVKVTVTDVSEGSPPQITSAGAVTVKENSTVVMTVTATDPDDTTQPPIEPPIEPPTTGNVLHATPSNFASQITASKDGDTILLAAGDYGTWSGTTKAITISPEAGASPKMKLSFNGNSYGNFTIDGLHSELSSSDNGPVRTTGPASFASPGIGITNLWVDQGSSARNVTIRRCWFTGDTTVFNGGNNYKITFDRCYWTGFIGYHAVHFSYPSSVPVAVTFKNCYWYRCSGDGLQIGPCGVSILDCEFDTVNPLGNSALHTDCLQFWADPIIRRCYFHNFEQGVFAGDGCSKATIEDNVIVAAPQGGAHFISVSHDNPPSLINHNTVVDGPILVYATDHSGTGPFSNTNVTNNIATSVGLQGDWGSSAKPTINNNMYISAAASGSNIRGTPVFVGGATPTTYQGFKLAAGSPGKSAASDGKDVGARIA